VRDAGDEAARDGGERGDFLAAFAGDRPDLGDAAGGVERGEVGVVAAGGGERVVAQTDRAGVEAGDDDAVAGGRDRAQAVEVGSAEGDGVDRGAAGVLASS